jgi:hypothetical protein
MRRNAALLLLRAALALGAAGAPTPAARSPPPAKTPPPARGSPPPAAAARSPPPSPPPLARAPPVDPSLVRASADAALDAYLAGRYVAVAKAGVNVTDVLSRAQGAGVIRRRTVVNASAPDADAPDLDNARLGVVSFTPTGGDLGALQVR